MDEKDIVVEKAQHWFVNQHSPKAETELREAVREMLLTQYTKSLAKRFLQSL